MNRQETIDKLFSGISDEHLAEVAKVLEPPEKVKTFINQESESYKRLFALGWAIADCVGYSLSDPSDYDSWPE